MQCRSVVLHDAYLVGLRPSALEYQACQCMGDDALLAFVAPRALRDLTHLYLVEEFLDLVAGAAPYLTQVKVRTQGLLRHGVPAGDALRRWAAATAEAWAARGVHFELEVDERMHIRRCVLQGATTAAELILEWGNGALLGALTRWSTSPGPRRCGPRGAWRL